MRAEGPGVLPAKGNALVIGSPPRNNPSLPFSITLRPNGPTVRLAGTVGPLGRKMEWWKNGGAVGGSRNQGGALRWANRRPFGARNAEQTSNATQTKCTSKAEQPAGRMNGWRSGAEEPAGRRPRRSPREGGAPARRVGPGNRVVAERNPLLNSHFNHPSAWAGQQFLRPIAEVTSRRPPGQSC